MSWTLQGTSAQGGAVALKSPIYTAAEGVAFRTDSVCLQAGEYDFALGDSGVAHSALLVHGSQFVEVDEQATFAIPWGSDSKFLKFEHVR